LAKCLLARAEQEQERSSSSTAERETGAEAKRKSKTDDGKWNRKWISGSARDRIGSGWYKQGRNREYENKCEMDGI
jgi:hypothetical protein